MDKLMLFLLKKMASDSAGEVMDYIEQHETEWSAKGYIAEHGTVTLTNTLDFPFNNSKTTVTLTSTFPDANYAAIAQITSSTGNAGEVEVSDRLVNGFKLSYTGGASSAEVDYIVIGGLFG